MSVKTKCFYPTLFIFITFVLCAQYFFISSFFAKNEAASKREKRIKYNHKLKYKSICNSRGRNGSSICKESDDDRLSKIIKGQFLDGPHNVHYNFTKNPPDLDGQIGVPMIIDTILDKKRDGFFIECGAYDGETISNTLFFELKRNFTGLLVEPNVRSYKKLLMKNRKVKSINACLSTSKLPSLVDFSYKKELSGIKEKNRRSSRKPKRNRKIEKHHKALCFPLYSILLAMGNPSVDYFSLDVEGAELSILQAIPWDKVDIKVLSIEVNHSYAILIHNLLRKNGYKLVQKAPSASTPQDYIYAKVENWMNL